MNKVDEIDQSIISQLQENARLSMTELGKVIGLSTPATNERVKKLEDKKLIKGYRAIIDPEKLNKRACSKSWQFRSKKVKVALV